MKKERGRPKKKPGQGKDELLQIRLSALEKQVFSSVAEIDGESVSVWARRELRRAAQRKIQENGGTDPFSTRP
jgi:hypothetical protein